MVGRPMMALSLMAMITIVSIIQRMNFPGENALLRALKVSGVSQKEGLQSLMD